MFKTIIVHVDDSPAFDSRLRAAAWLAGEYGAHLVGSAATGLSWPAYALLSGSMAVVPVDEFDQMRTRARSNLARFAEQARLLGVRSIEERLIEDEHRDALLLQSRYADLVVTSQEGGTAPAAGPSRVRGLPQYLVLHGPRPVLVVPPSYAGEPIAQSILIGWDGNGPALRAIDAALPLLQRALSVRLAVINPGRETRLHGDEPGADMALYLARHGVTVEVTNEHTAASAGDALLALARDSQAGLLVTGAFGHSRFREIVLGGVTRVLLERAMLPVLLAH